MFKVDKKGVFLVHFGHNKYINQAVFFITLGMSFYVQLPLLIISKIIAVSYINSANTKNYSVVSSVMHFDA